MNKNKRVVEINGVKLEIDLRTAKRVDQYKVGDNVKVLIPSYGSNYKVHPGVIVGFDDFKSLPTVTIAYLIVEYNSAEIKFAYLNQSENSEKIEIAPAEDVHELHFEKADVISKLDRMIEAKQEEEKDLQRKKAYFNTYFGKYFESPVKTTAE